jgi:hypothetical protein
MIDGGLISMLFGGVTGLIGKTISTVTMYKLKKAEFEHREKMIEKETQAMIQEAQAKTDLVSTIYEGKVDVQEAEAFKLSIKNAGKFANITYKVVDSLLNRTDKLKYLTVPIGTLLVFLMVTVDVIRVAMRPGMTSFYTAVMGYIVYQYLHFLQLSSGGIDPNLQHELLYKVIDGILYITTTCTVWWFGDRDHKRTLERTTKK